MMSWNRISIKGKREIPYTTSLSELYGDGLPAEDGSKCK